MKITFGIPITS